MILPLACRFGVAVAARGSRSVGSGAAADFGTPETASTAIAADWIAASVVAIGLKEVDSSVDFASAVAD